MAHIPFGYRVENGKVVIDENQAETVRTIFQEYLKGASLSECARASGYERKHSSIGRILMNEKYLGDGFYPPMIEDEMFYKAAGERHSRASRLGRIRDYSTQREPEKKEYSYRLGKVEEKFRDPFRQAEYIYSRVEMEEINGKNSNDDSGGEKNGKHGS